MLKIGLDGVQHDVDLWMLPLQKLRGDEREPTSCAHHPRAGLCVVTFPKSGPDSVRTQMMGGLFGGAVDVVTVESCLHG